MKTEETNECKKEYKKINMKEEIKLAQHMLAPLQLFKRERLENQMSVS